MTRTTISKTAHNEVTLSAIDPFSGEESVRVFWLNGSYVREGKSHFANDPQVCAGLSYRGNTLMAVDGDDLLRVIRREWQAYRKAAKQDLRFWW